MCLLQELNEKIEREEKALEQLRHLLVTRKRQFEEEQKAEQQRLARMKKKLQEERNLEEAKRKEEEKKRLEALQRKLEEQRKKEAQLQKEKWEALATPPAVTKRAFDTTKETSGSTAPVMEKKEQGSRLEDSWLLIDSPVISHRRVSPPPPRPRPYQPPSSQDASPKPRPRSEALAVTDVIIQPIRMPLQKAPIIQKRSKAESGSSSPKPEKGRSTGGDATKPEPARAGPQPAAPSSVALKEKVRDMQEKRLKVGNRMGTLWALFHLSLYNVSVPYLNGFVLLLEFPAQAFQLGFGCGCPCKFTLCCIFQTA